MASRNERHFEGPRIVGIRVEVRRDGFSGEAGDRKGALTGRAARLGAIALLTALCGCSLFKGKHEQPQIPKTADAETLYNYGIDALHSGRYELAGGEFELLQQNYPYSGFTGNAELMEGYAYYLQGEYALAVQQLDRYLQLHPTSPDAAYAFYLRALCYYEQIADVQRDQQGTVEAMEALEEVVTRFPQTDYARDAQLKIDLCRDHLAGKEMLVGRWYQQQRIYEAAMNRYQRVVQDFQTTNHVAEALERLVEVYLALGLTDQARQTAAVLGYNYPDSKWYKDAYGYLRNHDLLTADVRRPVERAKGKTDAERAPSGKIALEQPAAANVTAATAAPASAASGNTGAKSPDKPGIITRTGSFFSHAWHSVF